MADPFEAQLEAVIVELANALGQSKYTDGSDIISKSDIRSLQTRCLAAIQRTAGKDSIYYENAVKIDKPPASTYEIVIGQIGVAKSLLSDIQNGYLKTLEEIIHGDVFGDFLEMADHLTSSGYKDAGAVISGSTLEAHLRQLCVKHKVATNANGKPKRAETINAELTKAGVYSKLDQKNVTAWLGLRNDAAHGNYTAYDANQVALMTSSIRDFVTRNPA